MIDFDKVVREAMSRGYPIHKDDPILLMVTAINNLLEEYNASLEAAQEKQTAENKEIVKEWRRDAESTAARVLNAALEAGREASAKTMNEGATKVVSLITEEMNSAILHQKRELDSAVATVKRHTLIWLGLSGVLLGLAVLNAFS